MANKLIETLDPGPHQTRSPRRAVLERLGRWTSSAQGRCGETGHQAAARRQILP